MAYILAGVGDVLLLDKTGNPILRSKTLTESGISINVTAEDIRGGLSAPIIGRYFHSSQFSLNLVDATFNLQYLALNVGGDVTVGGEAFATESVTSAVEGQITVSGTPIDFGGMGTIGWYSLAAENNWKLITFTGNTASAPGLPANTPVCVKYNTATDNMSQFVVSADIIPSECYAILTAPLFAADSQNFTTSSKVGELVKMLCL